MTTEAPVLSPSAAKMLPELLALPRAELKYLHLKIADVLDLDEDDPVEVRAAWATEIRRRVEEIKSGKVEGIPAEEVDRLMAEKYP